MADQTVPPVSKAARVQSLYVLRGISLLGIRMMNITGFGLLFQAYDNPLADGGATAIDLAGGAGVELAVAGALSLWPDGMAVAFADLLAAPANAAQRLGFGH